LDKDTNKKIIKM